MNSCALELCLFYSGPRSTLAPTLPTHLLPRAQYAEKDIKDSRISSPLFLLHPALPSFKASGPIHQQHPINRSLFLNASSSLPELIMQFSISFIAISALFVTALASPQRSRPSRPSRPVVNVNAAPNQQSNVCGNESQNPFCCTTDNQSGQVQCVSNNSKFCRNLALSREEIDFDIPWSKSQAIGTDGW